MQEWWGQRSRGWVVPMGILNGWIRTNIALQSDQQGVWMRAVAWRGCVCSDCDEQDDDYQPLIGHGVQQILSTQSNELQYLFIHNHFNSIYKIILSLFILFPIFISTSLTYLLNQTQVSVERIIFLKPREFPNPAHYLFLSFIYPFNSSRIHDNSSYNSKWYGCHYQYKLKIIMSENPVQNNEPGRQERAGAVRQQVSFQYQMAEMKARKMVTLIRFSRLPYQLEEVTDLDAKPFLLHTPQGDLTEQYEIITYIVNDSFITCHRDGNLTDSSEAEETEGRVVSLCGGDVFAWARMSERLFQLRRILFPMLQEFYRYLFGHERVRKSKYEALLGKIKKEILKLDQLMSDNGDIFNIDSSFLNIIIACEMFVACKFVFEQKFRKSKWTLFNKCQKIAKRPEFQEVYGKASFCVKECLPVEFDDEEEPQQQRRAEEAIPIQIVKLVQSPQVAVPSNEKRNQLLYNFFRSTLKGQDSKASYFPYFWLMYDNLQCTLVELHYCSDKENNFQQLEKQMTLAMQSLPRLLKGVDYGFMGIYQAEKQKERHHRLQGLICLGSHSLEELQEELAKQADLRGWKAVKVQINSEEERKKVEMLWEYQAEGVTFEGVKVIIIRDF